MNKPEAKTVRSAADMLRLFELIQFRAVRREGPTFFLAPCDPVLEYYIGHLAIDVDDLKQCGNKIYLIKPVGDGQGTATDPFGCFTGP